MISLAPTSGANLVVPTASGFLKKEDEQMSKLKKFFKYLVAHKYVTTLVIFLCVIGFLDPNSLYVRYQLYQEERTLQSEIDAYSAQFDRDTKLYKELQSDPNAVVRIAREKYYMKKENEDVYIFENSSDDETTK